MIYHVRRVWRIIAIMLYPYWIDLPSEVSK